MISVAKRQTEAMYQVLNDTEGNDQCHHLLFLLVCCIVFSIY